MCNSLSICNINRIIFVLQTLRLTSYPDPGFDTCTPRSRPKQTASRMLRCWLASGSSGQWKEVAGGQAVGGVRIMEFVLPAPMPACCLAKPESLPEHNSYPGLFILGSCTCHCQFPSVSTILSHSSSFGYASLSSGFNTALYLNSAFIYQVL